MLSTKSHAWTSNISLTFEVKHQPKRIIELGRDFMVCVSLGIFPSNKSLLRCQVAKQKGGNIKIRTLFQIAF